MTWSFGAGGYDFFVIKLDENGKMDPSCAFIPYYTSGDGNTSYIPDVTDTSVTNPSTYATINNTVVTGVVSPGTDTFLCFGSVEKSCNNGVDDDGDGLVDCNDPDCPPCPTTTSTRTTTTTTTTTSTTTTTDVCRCPTDSPLGCISGRVWDHPAGNPLANKTVKLKRGTALVGRTKTDGNGCYQFTGLTDGIYKVWLSWNCWATFRHRVKITGSRKVHYVYFKCSQ